jgi:hypothetical protein
VKNLAIEYEIRCDLAAEKVVEARRILKEAKARLVQARLCAELAPSAESRRALLEIEFEVACAARNEIALLPKSSDANRVTQ